MSKAIDLESDIPLACIQLDGMVSAVPLDFSSSTVVLYE